MQWLIESLAAKHGVDLCQAGVSLTLTRPGQSGGLLLYNAGADHVVLARLVRDPEGQLLPEEEFLFFTSDSTGWKPVEIRYSPAAWATYVAAAGTPGERIDSINNGEAMLNGFVACWAGRLAEEGWLTEGQASVRISGCQSTNHTQCYGDLWQCSGCKKWVCYAEGTDNHPELCDDCWAQRYHPTLVIACDCSEEQCGA